MSSQLTSEFCEFFDMSNLEIFKGEIKILIGVGLEH